MAKISNDRKAGTRHPRENIFATANLAAAGAEFFIDCDGCSSFSLDLRGAFNLTVEVTGVIDGTNFSPTIPVRPFGQAAVRYVATVAGSANGIWQGSCAGFDRLRVRVSAWTSGAAIATCIASNAPIDQSLQGMVTTDVVTTIGAAGAATTLTLPAPGLGLRHYLTYIAVGRFAAAALTAAATPVNTSSTNIPGALAFSFPADAALQGTYTPLREDFAFPVAVSAQNTATTIVCPATPNVIWRATAGFYVAP